MREAKAAVDVHIKADPEAAIDPSSILAVAYAKSQRVIGVCLTPPAPQPAQHYLRTMPPALPNSA